MNYDLNEAQFYKLADIFYKLSGIKYGIEKFYLLENRLLRFIGDRGSFDSYNDLIKALEEGIDKKLQTDFVNTLTTNYSYFFREPVHFRFLNFLCQNKFQTEKELRFWSAAASAGQEAYSMAVAAYGAAKMKQIKILGTDIAADKIEEARNARYPAQQINGYLAPSSVGKFFRLSEDGYYDVKPALKNMVLFNVLNLKGEYPFNRKFHAIFLRNVLIYFKPEEKIEILNKIANVLHPQGYLILSLSESISSLEVPFKHVNNSIYKLK